MKKVFIISSISCAIFLLSCKDSTTTTTSSSAVKNRENINSVYRGIETGDLSTMDAFVADDIVDHYGMPDEITGRENVKKNLADIHNHFTNLKMEIVAEATSGDDQYHFTLVRMTGTTSDDKFGRPANTPVDEMSVDVVKMKDGKAVEHWGYQDAKMMMKMMQGHDMPSHDAMDTSKMHQMDTTMKH